MAIKRKSRRPQRVFLAVASAVFSIGMIAAPAMASVENTEQGLSVPSVRNEQQTTGGARGDGPSQMRSMGIFACTFFQHGDYVHISTWNSRPGSSKVASGHGWWKNGDCKAVAANVRVQLQAYVHGSWKDYGLGEKLGVYSGGGSANRAAAQTVCASYDSTHWRSKVDVDLIGEDDAANKLTTPEVVLACAPQ